METLNRSTQNMKRFQFFNDSLVYLSVASEIGFPAFQECATLIRNKLAGFPLELSTEFFNAKLDKVSMDIFPSQEFPDLVPVKVSGDGNCLPRSASMLVFGDQHHHVEMRVRMACELALNKEFYLDNDNHKIYDFDTFPYCSTITTYSPSFKPGMDTDQDVIEFVFEQDTMKTSTRGSFCGIWHLYALASIVGCKLYSIYPKLKSTVTIRPELNRIIFPRKQMSKKKVAIFWTNTNGIYGESFWSPNHFTPCFQKHFLLQAKQKLALKRSRNTDDISMCTPPRQMIRKDSLRKSMLLSGAPKKKTFSAMKIQDAHISLSLESPKSHIATRKATPTKRSVRFNVESKCDLAINFISKQTRKMHVQSIKKGKNPLKSIFKFFIGNQKESRGPDVSFYEIE